MPSKIKLSKDQRQFFSKTYSHLLKTVRLTFKELADCYDAEGIEFLRRALAEVGKEAKVKVRKATKSL